jgi:hypothetical protein
MRSRYGAWVLSAAALAGAGVFAFATGVLMQPHAALLGDRLPEMTCLQIAFTTVRATSIIMTFSPDQQVAIANLLIPGDVTFAWGYGLLLAGLVGLMARRFDGAWLRAGAVVMWLPLMASLLDVIEDVFLYAIVAQLVANPSIIVTASLPLLAGIAATLKYLALIVATPVYAVAGMLHGLRIDRRPGALLVYFLLFAVSMSMVARSVQQIPPCYWAPSASAPGSSANIRSAAIDVILANVTGFCAPVS